MAHDTARAANGTFLLRIEDIDHTRSRQHWEDQIYDDLAWLGITWDAPPMRQSDRLSAYRAALQDLWERGLLYPCFCSRRDIAEAVAAPQEGIEPPLGPDGLVYPGTCRPDVGPANLPMTDQDTLRINMGLAVSQLEGAVPLGFVETGDAAVEGPGRVLFTPADMTSTVGDIVLSRRDFLGSYHLSVVLDDAAQGITHVIRGADLFDATKIHVVLQGLFGLATPAYTHHRLIRDEAGRRLAKRDDARAIATYRKDGATPQDIRRMVGLSPAQVP